MMFRSFGRGAAALLVFVSLSPTFGCASDSKGGSTLDQLIKKEVAKLVPFDVVELRGPFEADIRVGSGPDLDIEGPAYLIDALEVTVSGDKLSLIVDDGVVRNRDDKIKVDIDTAALTALSLAGLSKTSVQAPVGPSLAINVSGASALSLKSVNVEQLTIEVGGAAEVNATGTAQKATYTLSGAGAFAAQELVAEDVTVALSGAGSVRVHATKRIKGAVSGIGKLAVAGAPADREVTVSGIGDVVYE